MGAIRNVALLLCSVAVFTVVALAQTAQSVSTPSVVFASGQVPAVAPTGAPPAAFLGIKPVTGSPYSAEQITERVQTLAAGTHITQAPQKTMLYRDSEGRTRTEYAVTTSTRAIAVSGASFVEIRDPVAGYRYSLNLNTHLAKRSPWPPAMHRVGATSQVFQSSIAGVRVDKTFAFKEDAAPSASSGQSHPAISDEALGTQSMEGLTGGRAPDHDRLSRGFNGKRPADYHCSRDLDVA